MFNVRKAAIASVSCLLLIQGAVAADEENGASGGGANAASSYTDGTYPSDMTADFNLGAATTEKFNGAKNIAQMSPAEFERFLKTPEGRVLANLLNQLATMNISGAANALIYGGASMQGAKAPSSISPADFERFLRTAGGKDYARLMNQLASFNNMSSPGSVLIYGGASMQGAKAPSSLSTADLQKLFSQYSAIASLGGYSSSQITSAVYAFASMLAKSPEPLPNVCFDRWWLTTSHDWQWQNEAGDWIGELSANAVAQYGHDSAPCAKFLSVDQIKLSAETVSKANTYEFYPKLKVKEKASNVPSLSVEASQQVASQGLPSAGACGGVVKTSVSLNGITWQATSTSGCYGEEGVQ